VREAVRWPLVDQGHGRYDWSTVDPVLDALNECHLTAIWDLCHYGFPDDCDPLSEACLRRFVDYCRAVAEHTAPRRHPPRCFTPINEISFFSGATTDMGWMYSFAKGKYREMKRALCRMDIKGVKAIRQVDPAARMVHVDPIIYEVPPPDRPDLSDEAWEETYQKAFVAWDTLAGRLSPANVEPDALSARIGHGAAGRGAPAGQGVGSTDARPPDGRWTVTSAVAIGADQHRPEWVCSVSVG